MLVSAALHSRAQAKGVGGEVRSGGVMEGKRVRKEKGLFCCFDLLLANQGSVLQISTGSKCDAELRLNNVCDCSR